ncbi:MAG: BREX protein BrxB domain-containing protein, partial [Bacilli bacterium]
GSMYPYLRVNEFLALYEDFNDTNKYKIIVFYPGHRDHNSFRLFGILPDNNTYRATLLINE